MRKQVTKDVLMLAAMACLPLVMLLGSHRISRNLDVGAAVHGQLTPGSLERLTGLALGLLGAVIMTWLLLGMLLAVMAALAARLGHRRFGAKIARLLPGFLARLSVATIGGSLILATSANAAAPHAAPTNQIASQPSGQPGQYGQESAGPHGEPGGSAGNPSAEAVVLSPGWIPQPISLPLQRLLGGNTRKSAEVVVRPGDTLWSIAARHLAPEATAGDVAEAWPQWHAANRELVGSNPDRLTVGMVLTNPESRNTRP